MYIGSNPDCDRGAYMYMYVQCMSLSKALCYNCLLSTQEVHVPVRAELVFVYAPKWLQVSRLQENQYLLKVHLCTALCIVLL